MVQSEVFLEDFQLLNWLKVLFEPCGINISQQPFRQYSHPLFFIPTLKNAKFALPIGSGIKGYWRGLDLYPGMLPGLILKKGLMAAGGLVTPLLKNRQIFLSSKIHRENPAQQLYGLLSENSQNLDKIKSFAARSGSAGTGFKLIFQFQKDGGEPVSYIKVGDPFERGIGLRNENNILRFLENYRDLARVPEVIGLKEHESFTSLEISVLKGVRYFPRPSCRRVAALLADLGKRTAILGKLKVIEETERQIEEYISKEKTKKYVKESIRYLSLNTYFRPLCHRDLAGWNVFLCEGGKLGILDWEFGKENHLPFQDLFHYFLHTKMHNSRLSPVQAYRYVFEKDRKVREAINIYARNIGVMDPELQRHLMVGYLWDWYSLERSRETEGEVQGGEYLEILDWLAENQN